MPNEAASTDKRVTLIDKVFKDREGHFVLFEAPNLPLIAWFTMILLVYPLTGKVALLATIVARGALFTWAWLELFQGVNYFRRGLGLAVLIYIVWGSVVRGTFV